MNRVKVKSAKTLEPHYSFLAEVSVDSGTTGMWRLMLV